MRGLATVAIVGFTLACTAPASAQGVLDGPLTAPDAAAAPKVPAASSTSKPRKKAPRHAAAKAAPAVPVFARETPDRQAPQRPATKADDPLSVGMKWNGSNDNSSQTRVQNYNGTAAGTGAEVGLKLHF